MFAEPRLPAADWLRAAAEADCAIGVADAVPVRARGRTFVIGRQWLGPPRALPLWY
jgi:hypothetical protein